jgi:hypothetical protein
VKAPGHSDAAMQVAEIGSRLAVATAWFGGEEDGRRLARKMPRPVRCDAPVAIAISWGIFTSSIGHASPFLAHPASYRDACHVLAMDRLHIPSPGDG